MAVKAFPKGGLIGKTAAFAEYLVGLKVSVYAAHACYFIVLALFPTLLLLLSLLRYTGLDVNTLTDLLRGVIPDALMEPAKRLIVSTYRNTSGTVVSLSALAALWSASRGVYGLLTGLNAIYGVCEDRGYFFTRTVSIAYTFALLLVLPLTLLLSVFGNSLLQMLPLESSALLVFLSDVLDLRFFLLLMVQTALFTAIFTVLPNRRSRFRDSIPGAVLASLGWLVFSGLYSVYVEHFAGLSNIYGSVYGVALSMLWLYCCISIVFYGGALNSYLASHP